MRVPSEGLPGWARKAPKTATASAPPNWRLVLKAPLAVPASWSATLGKFGLSTAPGFYEGADSTSIVAGSAPAISAATMFHVQLDDELFPLEGQLALFDLLRTDEKHLVGFPGTHGANPPATTAMRCDFLISRLRLDDRESDSGRIRHSVGKEFSDQIVLRAAVDAPHVLGALGH